MPGFDERRYEELLVAFHPRPIRSDRQCRVSQELIDDLLARPSLAAEEDAILDLVTTLVEQWERENVHIPSTDPVEVIRFLLDGAGKRQKDLIPIFGSESIVSEVLSRRRDLQRKHIAGLAAYFHVSPAVFFGDVRDGAVA